MALPDEDVSPVRPFKRMKMFKAGEYRILKRAVASCTIAVGKARWAKIVLLSNKRLIAREIAERLECNEADCAQVDRPLQVPRRGST